MWHTGNLCMHTVTPDATVQKSRDATPLAVMIIPSSTVFSVAGSAGLSSTPDLHNSQYVEGTTQLLDDDVFQGSHSQLNLMASSSFVADDGCFRHFSSNFSFPSQELFVRPAFDSPFLGPVSTEKSLYTSASESPTSCILSGQPQHHNSPDFLKDTSSLFDVCEDDSSSINAKSHHTRVGGCDPYSHDFHRSSRHHSRSHSYSTREASASLLLDGFHEADIPSSSSKPSRRRRRTDHSPRNHRKSSHHTRQKSSSSSVCINTLPTSIAEPRRGLLVPSKPLSTRITSYMNPYGSSSLPSFYEQVNNINLCLSSPAEYNRTPYTPFYSPARNRPPFRQPDCFGWANSRGGAACSPSNQSTGSIISPPLVPLPSVPSRPIECEPMTKRAKVLVVSSQAPSTGPVWSSSVSASVPAPNMSGGVSAGIPTDMGVVNKERCSSSSMMISHLAPDSGMSGAGMLRPTASQQPSSCSAVNIPSSSSSLECRSWLNLVPSHAAPKHEQQQQIQHSMPNPASFPHQTMMLQEQHPPDDDDDDDVVFESCTSNVIRAPCVVARLPDSTAVTRTAVVPSSPPSSPPLAAGPPQQQQLPPPLHHQPAAAGAVLSPPKAVVAVPSAALCSLPAVASTAVGSHDAWVPVTNRHPLPSPLPSSVINQQAHSPDDIVAVSKSVSASIAPSCSPTSPSSSSSSSSPSCSFSAADERIDGTSDEKLGTKICANVAGALAVGLVTVFDVLHAEEHNLRQKQLQYLAALATSHAFLASATATVDVLVIILTRFLPAVIGDAGKSTSGSEACNAILERMLKLPLSTYVTSWSELKRAQVAAIKCMQSSRSFHVGEVTSIIVRATASFSAYLDHFSQDWLFQLNLQGDIQPIPAPKKSVYFKLISNYFKPTIITRRKHRVKTIETLFQNLPYVILKQNIMSAFSTGMSSIASKGDSSEAPLDSVKTIITVTAETLNTSSAAAATLDTSSAAAAQTLDTSSAAAAQTLDTSTATLHHPNDVLETAIVRR